MTVTTPKIVVPITTTLREADLRLISSIRGKPDTTTFRCNSTMALELKGLPQDTRTRPRTLAWTCLSKTASTSIKTLRRTPLGLRLEWTRLIRKADATSIKISMMTQMIQLGRTAQVGCKLWMTLARPTF